MLTIGIEEEYLLLHPISGHPVPAAAVVSEAAGLRSGLTPHEVQRELLQAQLEIATPVCETLDEAGGHLLRLRHELAVAAESHGVRLAAVAAAPVRAAAPPEVTDNPRYHAIHAQAPQLVDEQLINGMHVHVAVPDRALGVHVVNRLQRWLPILLAMSASSPLWDGRDTGFASWRTLHFDRWPVAGPPPRFLDVEDYERRVEALSHAGIILDRAQLYWHARVSEQYPTVELRACDVQLRVDDAIMIAGMARGLAAAALEAEEAAEPMPLLPPELVRASSWHAARHGLSGHLLDLASGNPRSADEVVREMLEYVTPQLRDSGDLRQVSALVDRLLRDGTGAERQRQVLEQSGIDGLLGMVVAETVACWHPVSA